MNVVEACRTLAREGLVKGSQGNASERIGAVMLIKPSGASCAQTKFACSVLLQDGDVREKCTPSTDAPAHRALYNAIPEIKGVVHTHSPYATAWASAGWAIPCVTTGQSDAFGGDIPISGFCEIGGEEIGREIVRMWEHDQRRTAFLIRGHGVFTIGRTLDAAVKSAVMVEHCAHVTWLAQQMRGLYRLAQVEIDANYKRYHENYGQHGTSE
jgi:L-ribulose-5-phosphate 4-epimerase